MNERIRKNWDTLIAVLVSLTKPRHKAVPNMVDKWPRVEAETEKKSQAEAETEE